MPRPFVVPKDRETVTHEPRQHGSHPVPWQQDQDWIDWTNQGGGSVPADYAWLSNPKQAQELVSAG